MIQNKKTSIISSLKNKLSNKKYIASILLSLSFLLFAPHAHASFPILIPGEINSCGYLSSGGTYTISADFDGGSSLDSVGNCFVTDGAAGTVTVDGGDDVKTITVSAGNVALNAMANNTPGDVSSGLLDAASPSVDTIVIRNVKFVGFAGGIYTRGNDDSSAGTGGGNGRDVTIINSIVGNIDAAGGGDSNYANAGHGGSVSVQSSTVTSIISNGGSGSVPGSAGGYAGTITVTASSTTAVLSANGGSGGGYGGAGGSQAGSGGNGALISISNSTTSGATSNGGDGGSSEGGGGNGGNAGGITITDSVLLGNLSSWAGAAGSGYGYGSDGSVGGSNTISISSSGNLNISNININTTWGTVSISYNGILTTTNTNIGSAGNFVINGTSYGSYSGGPFPFLPGSLITSASQCAAIIVSGTYYLAGDLPAGDCQIKVDGVFISSTSTPHVINGNVTSADGISSVLKGIDIDLSNVVVTGHVSSGSGIATDSYGGKGGNISILNSTVGYIVSGSGASTNSYYNNYYSQGGSGGNISIISSTSTSVSSGVGGSGDLNYGNSGNGGDIVITGSTVTTVASGYGASSGQGSHGGSGGSISVTNSTTGTIDTGFGGDSDYQSTAGNGGRVLIAGSTTGSITAGYGGTDNYGNGGNGGSVSISGVDLNLSNITIAGGHFGQGDTSNGYYNGANGSLYISYTGTINVTGLILSALSSLQLNNSMTYNFPGGSFPMLSGASLTSSSQCSSIVFPGTYYLAGDLPAGDCIINAEGVTIDGTSNHYTINGNVTSTNGVDEVFDYNFYQIISYATAGKDVSLANVIITGLISAGNGGFSSVADGGWGGNITITNSTSSSVTSGNGGSGSTYGGGANGGTILIRNSSTGSVTSGYGNYSGNGGSGGGITIINSITGFITSGYGSQGDSFGGYGGNITISGTNLNLLDKTIYAGSGGYGQYYSSTAPSGTLTITYSSTLSTNASTIFNNISNLVINSVSYGAWNGVYNPTNFYFTNSIDGNWNNLGNWWSHYDGINFSDPATSIPGPSDKVYVFGNITNNTAGEASVSEITFNSNSTNQITISSFAGAIFKDSSKNLGSINGAAIFEGDLSDDNGFVNNFATWTPRDSSRRWYSITSSADGTKLAAVDYFGYIYTSTSSGVTWTTNGYSSGQHYWSSITSSADGTMLAAVDYNNGYIYTSTNSGATWTTNGNSSGQH
ncbi:MAG: hypothetical protein WCQ00_03730, partial [bacterium]